ncbi:hypothetical protein P152DRAFT_459533 [Eremomyces bilateralis CBS 781.70]|uniref:Transcription factor SWI6 n=1 Tax=Eremomyces bilateralis CBS 781.70 TaxID=1392243 RepID=A0A6G1G0Z2_9PEZI|nr:uncharacterized protein P152DRAFT_459533 [Eremomyces bilateralis CBS 781.70]KAF1811596.1 hypothetical protein P152DRAFT_459533 [Eremomyces bilateralis CBS 781.70]
MSATIESVVPPQPLPIAYSRAASSASNLEGMQYQASYDGRQPSFSSSTGPSSQMSFSASQSASQPTQPTSQSAPNSYRNHSHANGHQQVAVEEGPAIYRAVYSGVSVYEMEVNGIAVMRRRPDSWLNATQVLKVAGVDKGKRTKVLEREVQTGEHEKVQGGYGKYQGTWINFRRGREFCRQYGVEELLRPLLDYDITIDDNLPEGSQMETPTKEQAMAALRKRFYNTSMDGRVPVQTPNGTFFSNISPTASNALAAMNKVARINSPAPRPGSAQKRPGTNSHRYSQQHMPGSQESFRNASQQSMQSFTSERSFNGPVPNEPVYLSQGSHYGIEAAVDRQSDFQEPPRKRMRSSQEDPFSQLDNGDADMLEGTPTEPNESFVYRDLGQLREEVEEVELRTPMPAMPHPGDKIDEDKQALLMDLFADLNRTDYVHHEALTTLSGTDFDIPLDNSANTALHWAATLARVPLLRLLISQGANIFRGNVIGQTPLMSAVTVNNCLEQSCFPELLETLSPLIEYRDTQGRTILHHIAVSSGIKGRATSSKYYLEALLEYLVRSSNTPNGQPEPPPSSRKPIGLMRFMSEMVNARDKGGNTALNLVARIGNRSIIQQLIEVQADPTIPNFKGLRPIDFGVGTDSERTNSQIPMSQTSSPSKSRLSSSRIDESSREILPSLSSFLSQTDSQFTAEIQLKQEKVDETNGQIRDVCARQRSEGEHLAHMRRKLRDRSNREQRIANLKRALADQRVRLQSGSFDLNMNDLGPETVAAMQGQPISRHVRIGDADDMLYYNQAVGNLPINPALESYEDFAAYADQLARNGVAEHVAASLPATTALRAILAVYHADNQELAGRAAALKARDGDLEARYRRVVCLCTGVEEDRVDDMLANLVAAVESERDEVEVSRVREFLRKVNVTVTA